MPSEHRDLIDGLDELLDGPLAEMEPAAEIAHIRRQSRPESMGADLGGDGGLIDQSTVRAGPRVGLVLGDDRGLLGEFGDLMPTRLGIVGTGIDRQRRAATRADRRDVGHDLVDAIGRQANPVVTTMSGLTAGTPPSRRLANRLGSVEWISRRRRRTIGGIAIEQEEKFFDLGFEHGDPSEGRVEFTTQPRATGTSLALGRFVR